MDYSTLNDEALMRLIAQARAEALAELYDRYGRLVFSLAMNATGDPSLAEEITQEVFIQIWMNAGAYRADQGKVSTWLTSITRYRAIDAWRRLNSRPETISLHWAEVTGHNPSNPGEVEQRVEQRLHKQQVREAISELPEEQQRTLALAYFLGYTHREISKVMGAPLGTVKTRIRLALQKLRAILKEGGPSGQ